MTPPNGKQALIRALPASAQDAAAMAGVTPLRILSELMRLAMVDIGEAFTPEGHLKPIHEIPEDVRRAIAGIDVSEIYEGVGENRQLVGLLKKVRFWDKQRALETLAKHLGLLVERVKLEANDDLADLIREARKRAAMAPALQPTIEVSDEVPTARLPSGDGPAGADTATGDPAERHPGAEPVRGDHPGGAAGAPGS